MAKINLTAKLRQLQVIGFFNLALATGKSIDEITKEAIDNSRNLFPNKKEYIKYITQGQGKRLSFIITDTQAEISKKTNKYKFPITYTAIPYVI